jgi:hypothetical protein
MRNLVYIHLILEYPSPLEPLIYNIACRRGAVTFGVGEMGKLGRLQQMLVTAL